MSEECLVYLKVSWDFLFISKIFLWMFLVQNHFILDDFLDLEFVYPKSFWDSNFFWNQNIYRSKILFSSFQLLMKIIATVGGPRAVAKELLEEDLLTMGSIHG